MATATFRFHGELSEFLARDLRDRAFEHACARAATVKHAIESLGVPHTEAGRLLVNGQPATLARIVRQGDAVEVFPHDSTSAATEGTPDFLADAHLGGLARMLRMLGFDTLYDNGSHDAQIREVAAQDGRIVLTRDRDLLKCRTITHGCFVHALKPEQQLREIVERLQLAASAKPFTLCLNCNQPLNRIEKNTVLDRIPPNAARYYERFSTCRACGGIFWEGSHWKRMRALLGKLLPDQFV